MYEYKTRFLPANVTVKKGNLATVTPQIEEFFNSECHNGWEYYRSDSLNLIEQSGCLGGMFGASATVIPVVMFVFRRDRMNDTQHIDSLSQAQQVTPKNEIAWMERSGIRVGAVLSKDHQFAYVRKDNGVEEKFLLTSLKFTLE